MDRKLITPGIQFESNTEYYYEGDRLEIRPEDAIFMEHSARFTGICGKDYPYYIAFLTENRENITIDFGGATLYLYGKIEPFIFVNCKNITLKNLSVQYNRSHFTECDIVEMDKNHIRITVDREKYPFEVVDGNFRFYCDEWSTNDLNRRGCFYQMFDKKTGDGIDAMVASSGTNQTWPEDAPCTPVLFTIKEEADYLDLLGEVPDWYLSSFRNFTGPEGAVLMIGHEDRRLAGVKIYDCTGVTIENMRLINGSGMGIEPIHSKDITLRGFKLFRDEKSVGIVTNSADAVHGIAVGGDMVLEDCVLCDMEDDALNVHGSFYRVDEVFDGYLTALVPYAGLSADCKVFGTGDEVAFRKGQTMELRSENRVLNIEKIDRKKVKMTFTGPIDGVKPGDTIENMSYQANLTIQNCVFDHSNTHLRFQTRGKIRVSDCKIALEILLTGDVSYWFESSPVQDMVVENCDLVGRRACVKIIPEVMPCEKEPYYHKNISFIGNRISSEEPIEGGYCDNLVFRDNVNVYGKPMRLVLTNCGRVDADCEVIRKTEVKTELSRN